jgi:hypothetical protein
LPDKNEKKTWVPKDLYQTPEFSEDERSTTIYEKPEKHGRLSIVAIIIAIAALAFLSVMILTGMWKIPPVLEGLFSGTAKNVGIKNTIPLADMPVICEIMTNNKGALVAGNGKYYDWIEIYNPTDHAVNLSGFGLSDNPDKPGKFVLPDYSLGSGKYVVVFASGKKSTQSEIHASFKLTSSGALLFTNPDGREIQRIDYPKMPQDTSYAMDMNDFTKWAVTDKITPGYSNTGKG